MRSRVCVRGRLRDVYLCGYLLACACTEGNVVFGAVHMCNCVLRARVALAK